MKNKNNTGPITLSIALLSQVHGAGNSAIYSGTLMCTPTPPPTEPDMKLTYRF